MGCPYSFNTMWQNLPKRSDFDSRDTLYPYLGWGDENTLMTSPAWRNTCAIRMSVCLIRCGMTFDDPPIGARIQASCQDQQLRGKAVVLKFDRLAKILEKKWGEPTKYQNVRPTDLNNQKGVVTFFGLPGGYPGHIDLIRDNAMPWTFFGWVLWDSKDHESGTGHYFGAREAWFWPSRD